MQIREDTELKNFPLYCPKCKQESLIGAKSIDTVKQSDAKEWAIRMSEKGFAFQSISNYNITMTLNYYAHATYDSAKAEMERLAA